MLIQTGDFPQPIYSVSDLNAYIRALLESNENLMDIWVEGEVSNVSQPRSGHVYFTLRDSESSVRCVVWRMHASRMAGVIRDGMQIEAHAYVSVYEAGGQYQLNVDGIRAAGEGRLYREFLLLKDRLTQEGLFDENRKRPIPSQPRSIGIVTSPTGAALQDMLNIFEKRFPMVEVVISPASVQGDSAKGEIVLALKRLNTFIHPDVILIGRGGGSLEDLWSFNAEEVVRAVAESDAPVISGVGHETDFTLTDFAADLRAPTPTGAAVLAVPDIKEVKDRLQDWEELLGQVIINGLEERRAELGNMTNRISYLSPGRRIKQNMQYLDSASLRLDFLAGQYFLRQNQVLELADEKIASSDPRKVLKKGYAMVEDDSGRVISKIKQVKLGQNISVHVSDGTIDADVTGIKEKD